MRQVSLLEANQNFLSCIAEVESGETLVLLRRGKPIAEIVPYTENPAEQSPKRQVTPDRAAAIDRLMTLLGEGLPLGGVPPTRDEMHER